jgi:two-component system, LytTR family, sensor kinase
MRWGKEYIGFNDLPFMAVGIPLFSLLIPMVFFGWRIGRPPGFPKEEFWACLIVTSIIWIGCRFICVLTRRRYPLFKDCKKRLWLQMGGVVAYALLINNLSAPIINKACERLLKAQSIRGWTLEDLNFNANAATVLCTLLIVAMYESVYYMNELRKSVEEKELLKRESLQAQLNALKTQVNPHFLFNNLNTLSAVIPENPGQAVDFVQQLSKVYRHILEVKDEQSIPLKDELEVLEAYAFLLQTRFGDNLAISIRVEAEKMDQQVVPLSLQILMENAIKHNIVSAAKPLHIDICTDNGALIVSNNLQPKNQLTESTGIGLDNIRNRYRLLGERKVEVAEGPSSFTVRIPLIT